MSLPSATHYSENTAGPVCVLVPTGLCIMVLFTIKLVSDSAVHLVLVPIYMYLDQFSLCLIGHGLYRVFS